jgi:hypothetical protein
MAIHGLCWRFLPRPRRNALALPTTFIPDRFALRHRVPSVYRFFHLFEGLLGLVVWQGRSRSERMPEGYRDRERGTVTLTSTQATEPLSSSKPACGRMLPWARGRLLAKEDLHRTKKTDQTNPIRPLFSTRGPKNEPNSRCGAVPFRPATGSPGRLLGGQALTP